MKFGKFVLINPFQLVVAVLIFLLLFIYSSLNLKHIDYGYQIQELRDKEKALKEEIDRLRAEKSVLLNLERVEKIAVEELGYQYPQPGQIIRIFKDSHEN